MTDSADQLSSTSHPQRVLLVHRYFWPDVPTYAQMMDRFATDLARLGHDVTVLCGPPSYNGAFDGTVPRAETRNGYRIVRARVPSTTTRAGKLLSSMLFPVVMAAHAISRKRPYDVVSVTTIPPVVMGLFGQLSALRSRKTRLVYHCMDLYPEVAAAIGLSQAGLVARIARRLDNLTIRNARRTIVLSDDMMSTLEARGADTRHCAVCNNFVIDDAEHAIPAPSDLVSSGPTRFVFAGNLGRFQGIESLVEAFGKAIERGADAELVFLGAGALSGWIEDVTEDTDLPVRLWAHRPLNEAMGLIQTADVGIVSLAPGVVFAAYPSKLTMYLELGLPVIAIVEPESELARTVTDRGVGITAPPDDIEAIAEAFYRASKETHQDAAAVHETGRKLFGPELVLDRWAELYGLDG